jgi:predicted transcriptional regulator
MTDLERVLEAVYALSESDMYELFDTLLDEAYRRGWQMLPEEDREDEPRGNK